MTGQELTGIARVALPMFLLMCVAVVVIYLFPGIATWLPGQMMGR
jgi:TRAP-type C4-dicarboxylate transport system permease large subunit